MHYAGIKVLCYYSSVILGYGLKVRMKHVTKQG